MLKNTGKRINYKYIQSRRVMLIWLIIIYFVQCSVISGKEILKRNQNVNESVIGNNPFVDTTNVTILHEVIDDHPISLNTHEILPLRTLNQKTYKTTDKTLTAINYAKSHASKQYELHPVTFDFNLGDLEDLEHEPIQKGVLDSEEQRLIRLGEVSELSYEPVHDSNINSDIVDVDIDKLEYESTRSTLQTHSAQSTKETPTTPKSTAPGTHILKIVHNKSTKKGRELLKQNNEDVRVKMLGSTINSINRLHGFGTNASTNFTIVDSLYGSANYFQIVTNLYDHFYWQIAEIRTNVRTGCGLEMQAYLTALHSSNEWAQQAYDASGRYRGQLLFGNDQWLGQLSFCNELNRQSSTSERKHIELDFYVASILLNIPSLRKTNLLLNLGECLPKSCSVNDVQSILTLDPYAHMLTVLSVHNKSANEQQPTIEVVHVRTVPGNYNHWVEVKFQIFIIFIVTLFLVMLVATCYQFKIDERKLSAKTIPAISGKCDVTSKDNDCQGYYGKPFELFQMRPLSQRSIGGDEIVDIDVNGNRQRNLDRTSEELVSDNVDVIKSISSETVFACKHSHKNELPDYQRDVGSIGMTGTYESEKPIGFYYQILLCFALQTNAKAILNIEKIKESHTSCLHGLRVFSVLWTMMVHTYLQIFAIGENKFERVITERSMWYQVIGNATFSVDSFFFISGLLVTLIFLKQDRKYPSETRPFVVRSCMDTVWMLLYRYLRLTPVYLFVILFYDFAVRQGLDSSVFHAAKIEHNTCRLYWWRNILYINNFFPQREMCMIWSWYMANDMQFYIMAALLLAVSKRYLKIVMLILIILLVSSWGIAGIISLQHQYTHKVALPFESFDFLYDKPWQRVGAYIIGMFAGFILYKVKTPPQVSKRCNMMLWWGSLSLLLIVVFGVWEGELSSISTAFYVGVGHTAFGCGLVWIVLSCSWGLAPTINAILSYRVLWPLSRLTYSAYLIHPIIMFICSSHMSGTVHLNNIMILTMFLGNAVVSFIAAFVISALFEAPVIRVLKICFKK